VFGRGYELYHDGPDPDRLKGLTGKAKTRAEAMLRRGIRACGSFAAEAVEGAGWPSLIPDLKRAATASDLDFRTGVILALKRLGSTDDFSAELIEALSGAPSERARISAAMGARLYSLDRFRAPLLDRMRLDSSWFVRLHAAESLLHLADIYPRGINEHRAISDALGGPELPGGLSLLDRLDLSGSRSAREAARYADAAKRMDAAITARLAAGACPKATPYRAIDLYIVPLSERVVALVVPDSIGPCERNLAFVVFLQSQGGFDRLAAGIAAKDPLKVSIDTRPAPVTVEYRRSDRVLTVGSVLLDTTNANVVAFSVDGSRVAARYKAAQSLAFARNGRPPLVGAEVLDSQPEVAASVRAIVDRTPPLRDLIQSQVGPGGP
jgi:hypothetical protein